MSRSDGALADGETAQATFDLEQLERRPPRVHVAPGPSLFALAADVAGARRGSPSEWIAAARAELEPADLGALAPIGAPPGHSSPGRVTFTDVDGPSAVAEALERIASLPIEPLLDDISFVNASSPPERWEPVLRHPRRWLVHYARALGRVWKGMREPWAAAATLIDREIERVETAVARGALPELAAGLHHDAEVRDGIWRFPDPDLTELRLPEEGLALRPLLAGPGSARVTLHADGLFSTISYPLPGAVRVLGGEMLPPAAALETLLGAQRAGILRLLDSPRHAGGLAEAMVATPGAATHHLRALEAAGLIVRERVGRQVVVHRTVRGSALLGLYSET